MRLSQDITPIIECCCCMSGNGPDISPFVYYLRNVSGNKFWQKAVDGSGSEIQIASPGSSFPGINGFSAGGLAFEPNVGASGTFYWISNTSFANIYSFDVDTNTRSTLGQDGPPGVSQTWDGLFMDAIAQRMRRHHGRFATYRSNDYNFANPVDNYTGSTNDAQGLYYIPSSAIWYRIQTGSPDSIDTIDLSGNLNTVITGTFNPAGLPTFAASAFAISDDETFAWYFNSSGFLASIDLSTGAVVTSTYQVPGRPAKMRYQDGFVYFINAAFGGGTGTLGRVDVSNMNAGFNAIQGGIPDPLWDLGRTSF